MTDDAPQGDPPAFRSNDGLGPLPESPTFYRYQFQAHYGPVWRSSAENWNGCPPLASEGLYSAEQMRAYAAQGAAAERERIFGHIRGAMGHAEAGYDDVAWRLLATLVGPNSKLKGGPT